jgi:hypothetical protein
MALGKFLRVQMGMDFSGGSRDEPYDSVTLGTTTCSDYGSRFRVLGLGLRVEGSGLGFRD